LTTKTRKVISTTTFILVGVYLLAAYLMWGMPVWMPLVVAPFQWMMSTFFLFPVAFALGAAWIMAPFVLIILAMFFTDWGMHKVLGLDFDY
jgi:hypothetical protein